MLRLKSSRTGRISDMDNTAAAVLQPIPVSAVVADYAELFKLRVNSLVVLTSWCGAYLAMGHFSWPSLVHIVVGIGSVAGGTAALNEVLERDSDGKMLRTARRPLVTGRISISAAVFLGVGLVIGGVFYLVIPGECSHGCAGSAYERRLPVRVYAVENLWPGVHGSRSHSWSDARSVGLGKRRRRDGFACPFAFLDPVPLAVSPLSCDRSSLSGRLPASRYSNAGGSGSKRTSHCDTDSCMLFLLGCRQHDSVCSASQWHHLRRIRRGFGRLVVLARDPALPGIVRFERC